MHMTRWHIISFIAHLIKIYFLPSLNYTQPALTRVGNREGNISHPHFHIPPVIISPND